MKTRIFALTVAAAALVCLLAFSAGSLAAKPPGAGNGGGGGGGGGDEVVIPDYGDLIILYRDADGVPIPSDETQVPDPETGEMVDGGLCWQPIAFQTDDLGTCPVALLNCSTANPCLVPVDQYNCGVEAAYAGCTQEVDFGRMNSARAPDSVYESQLADVVVNLATADCVTLDPAGRLVTSRVETFVEDEDEYDVVTSGAIDSPLQNLAIYKQLMMYGYLGDVSNPIVLPASALDTAARGLGAGSGKTGEVNVDLVAYLNQIMGLTDPATSTILDPKICKEYREEVMGNIERVEKCFLNYGASGSQYGYTRNENFLAIPAPAYIPATQGGDGKVGWFEVLEEDNISIPFAATFKIFRGPIFERVFGNTDAGSGGDYGIDDFAQAADDARAVINYMHSWPLPVDYATPFEMFEDCDASTDIAYDVSISAESGLQVPRNIIDGSEGREFTVTVANASGSADSATVTVRVTATPENGGTIVGSPWEFDFDLDVGESWSETTFFTVNLGERTTINWEAVAVAPDDVNPSNNTQTATSNVKVTGSGGGGGKP